MLSTATRQVYTEIDNFIDLLDENERNKIPERLRMFFKKEKDNNYKKEIDINIPIQYQNLKEETLALIAILNLEYWCEDKEEKLRLKRIYFNNEEKYQKDLREKYNFTFNAKIKPNEKTIQKDLVISEHKKNSIFSRIKEFIKTIFKKNRT